MRTVKAVFLFILFGFPSIVSAGDIKTPHGHTGIRFTENKNQWNSSVLYRAQLDGGVLFFQNNSLLYNFYDKEAWRNNHAGVSKGAANGIRKHAFKATFLNSLSDVKVSGRRETPDYSNFYLGNDKNRWAAHARNFSELYYTKLYSKIDMQVLGKQNSVKYNFIVAPGGNPNDIRILYEGVQQVYLSNGDLIIKTSINEITEQRPYSYQKINGKVIEVQCAFLLEDETLSFSFSNGYNKNYDLIIDPVLVFACSSGSTADNFGMTATNDAGGNLYAGGTCFSIGYPTTLGAYDTTTNNTTTYGKTDVVATKYSSDGTTLLYSTYIGGDLSAEIVSSLVVDSQNNLLLYGATGSSDFPVTSNAYDTSFNGGPLLYFRYNGTYFDYGTDIYVAKFNSTGTSLIASTYIGGTMNDGVNVNNDSIFTSALGAYEFPTDSLQYNYGDQYRGEIQVDLQANAYIVSSTRSGNFPAVGGLDNTLGGKQDAVLIKLNSDFTSLVFSSFIGGSDNDAGYSLTLTDSDEIYLTGGTRSNNFPVTSGAYMASYNGGKADGFVVHINASGNTIVNSSYIGTNDYDQSYLIQRDSQNNVYVFGQSLGVMPVVNAPYYNQNAKQFIIKFNPTLSSIVFCTTLGSGSSEVDISPSAFLVDNCENIYLSGWGGKIVPPVTSTTLMPLTSDAVQSVTDGHDFYVMAISTNASALLYGSYFGGAASWEHVDGGTSRFDKNGVLYQSVCAGCGGNDDFPVTPGAWPYTSPDYTPFISGSYSTGINMSANCNNGTFKFDFQQICAATEITIVKSKPQFSLYPNPSTGKFIIKDSGKDFSGIILNVLGDRVYDLDENTLPELDLTHLSKGVYFIKILEGEKLFSEKIIIQ
jgi:hypothetical protein